MRESDTTCAPISADMVQRPVTKPDPIVYVTRRLITESVLLNPERDFRNSQISEIAMSMSAEVNTQFKMSSMVTTLRNCVRVVKW